MKHSKLRNNLIYLTYYERLSSIARSIFKWENLPETCNERFLEKCLYYYGRAIFVKDEDLDFLNLKATPSDTLNVYEEPTEFHAYSVNYDKFYKADECVYIRNNYLETPTDKVIMLFAEKLARIDISILTNINAQKTPIMIKTDEKTKNSLMAVYNQYDGDKPFILTSKALQEKPLDVLRTDAPFLADKLREEKRSVWNECLEFLGINTNPSDKKKERLIVNEVDANNEQIDIQYACMFLSRQQACEQINKKYGLNVSVVSRIKEFEETLKGVDDSGTIYS